ncbi:uncharacterized protein [Periplaneta americana]|uniref:uncharacterized protein isoform X2 n=1 Tax=Periplaneta americana TaxID=6978 RepID=UPI0037E86B55
MFFKKLIPIASLVLLTLASPAHDREALKYLVQYGYVDPQLLNAAANTTDFNKSLETALRDFQIFAGLESTGVLNNETLGIMKLPRCGEKDKFDFESDTRRTCVDLFPVALHEFGHALGLNHTSSNESIMNPFNSRIFNKNFTLSDGDIRAIQSLYGVKRNQTPDLCSNSSFDAIFEYPPGIIYVLKDDYYWKLYPDGLASGYPKLISHRWPGLPGSVDAATATSAGLIYFFKKNKYWCYNYYSNTYRNPYYISLNWLGIPDNVQGAMWGGHRIFYFFKGDLYWKYDASQYPQVPATYPKPITDWGGIKGDLEDVLYVTGRRIYFFSNSSYYSYNCETGLVDYGHPHQPDYPRPTGLWWFRCGLGDTNELMTTTVNTLTSQSSTITVVTTDNTTLETSTNTSFVTVSNNLTTEDVATAPTIDDSSPTIQIDMNETTTRRTNVSDYISAQGAVDYFDSYEDYRDGDNDEDYNDPESMETYSWKSGASSPMLMTLVNILILVVTYPTLLLSLKGRL